MLQVLTSSLLLFFIIMANRGKLYKLCTEHAASSNGDAKSVRALLQSGMQVDEKDDDVGDADVRCLLVRGSCASGVEPALTPPPRLDVERALLALELALEVEEVDGDARFFERTEVAAAVLFELAVGLTADARAGDLEPGLGLFAALELAVFAIALGLAALGLTFGSGAPLRLNSYPLWDRCLPFEVATFRVDHIRLLLHFLPTAELEKSLEAVMH